MDKRNWVILILILIIVIIVIIFYFCCNYDAKANIESFIENVTDKGLNSLIEEYSGEKVSKKNNGAKKIKEVTVSDNIEEVEETIEIEPEIPDAFLRDTRVSMDFPESGIKRSKPEQICKKALEKIFRTKFSRIRPDWLKNPKTGRNLELDCFSAEAGKVYNMRGIACEVNGIQHVRWPNWTGMSKEDFLKQVERDKFKLDTCDANGVYLIVVPHNVKNELIPDFIEYMLPHNVQRRRELQLTSE